MPLRWQCCAFDALSARRLQFIYMARQRVFCVEQDCVYLDVDGVDERSLHLGAWGSTSDEPLAYARIVAPGQKYAEASIGRVLTQGPVRGTGLGRELVRRAIAAASAAHPGHAVRISAQQRLERFYAEAGFVGVGAPYLEDGLPHLEMLLSATAAARHARVGLADADPGAGTLTAEVAR